MEIKKFNISDYEQAYSLWYGNAFARRRMRSLDDSKEGILRFLERNPNTCFSAKENGIIIGTVLAGNDGRRGYIYHMVVNENFRRRGTGKALVNTAVIALKNEGINKIGIVVFSDNENGNTFWEKIGFILRKDLIYRNFTINNNNI